MRNTTLIFRSLLVVSLLAGAAHYITYAAKQQRMEPISAAHSAVTTTPSDQQEGAANPSAYNPDTDYIVGEWKVSYETKEFTGSIIYTLKKEGSNFVAYTARYEDAKGRSQEAEGNKTLVLESFDGYLGRGTYTMEYEGERYDASCRVDMVDENTFQLSYDFQGYGDVETWKRLP